jgi:hypothetical protein
MLKAAQAGAYLGISAKEAAEVEAELARSLPWALAFAAKVRGSGYVRHLAAALTKKVARRNANSAKRHAAKLRRTPPWADQALIRSVYEQARQLTESTGVEHHVDHIYPLQGRLVSGLHVHTNLQVLPGADNCRKNNRYEV